MIKTMPEGLRFDGVDRPDEFGPIQARYPELV
jgi:hypothetical protein